jgi:uroporphyrin-III C-methyltransferase/precorrin-2 dehydrogenase/sirohydrochlorin ferrochelatase
VAEAVTLHSLPLFVRLEGRPVILLGEGDAADAKRRLLERAGANVVGEEADAALAIVAIEDEAEAHAAVARLKARGALVNAVDRPALCDFTLPAIVDRDPVLIAIGTGGVSAGLAAALRQRLEAILPERLGRLAQALHGSRAALRARWPDATERRRMIAAGLAPGALLDPLGAFRDDDVDTWMVTAGAPSQGMNERITLHSPDPDDLTLRQARLLANADRVVHSPQVPAAILDRARADAARFTAMPADPPGLTVIVEMA